MNAQPAPVHALFAAPYPEIVDRLLYYAAQAPSPHNAQGWNIQWQEGVFSVRLDRGRQVLGELDPSSLEGELACGAAVANLEAAAAALGFRAQTLWRPERGDATLLAEVRLLPGGSPDEAALRPIRERAVNRSPYEPYSIPIAVLGEIEAIAREAGFTLSVLTARAGIAEVAALAGRAGRLKLAHGATSRELYDLMRFSSREAARRRDGLDLDLFDLPAGAKAASAVLLHPKLLELFGAPPALARQAEEVPLSSAPAVCLLYGAAGDGDAFLRGGRAFQRIALSATRHGLALQPHSAAIEVALARPGALDPALPAAEVDAIDAALRRAFGCPEGARPIVLFRLGTPTRRPARKSLRRSAPPQPVADAPLYRELTRRNEPVISPEEQAALSGLRVLFAGCGSIGGAPVEVLARMGLQRFTLAEPGDYELNNLNRQAALCADVGRNKAEVLRDRVLGIHASAEVLVEPRGVTAENVDWLVGSTDLIIDGVDVTEEAGIAAKRLLHEEAWRQRRVVILGLDLGGTQVVRVYDYRNPSTRPFDGKLDGCRERISAMEFLARVIEPLDMPMEMLGYTEAMIRGHAGAAPQLAPTANLFGVLAAWAALDFACGRPLRRRVSVDVPGLLMPLHRRLFTQAVRIAKLARLKFLLEVKRARSSL
jgi:hypothetical protein